MKKYCAIFLCFISVVCGCFSAYAEDGLQNEAKKFVESLGERAIEIVSSKEMSEDAKAQKLETLFDEYVDTKWMANFALGQYRRTATPEQRAEFEKLYHNFLIKKYMPKFKTYTGETLFVTNVNNVGENGEFIVQTTIHRPDKPPLHIDYRVIQPAHPSAEDPFNVIDIVAEGVSLINTHRSEFGSIISQKGMDEFLNIIRSRVETGAVEIPEKDN